MKQLKEMLSENTPVSIGLVITLLGGIFWLTSLYAKTEATANTVNEIKDAQKEYNKNLMEINQRLSRIEGKLESIR